jgi:hypothetical protein
LESQRAPIEHEKKGTDEHNKGMLMSKISQKGINRAQQGGANKHQ